MALFFYGKGQIFKLLLTMKRLCFPGFVINVKRISVLAHVDPVELEVRSTLSLPVVGIPSITLRI